MLCKIRIEFDSDTEIPLYNGWQVRFFKESRESWYARKDSPIHLVDRDDYFRDTDSWGEPVHVAIGVQSKINSGTATWLRVYNGSHIEHGEGIRNPNAILWFDGDANDIPVPREDVLKAIVGDLREWQSGNCYWYHIEREDGSQDSCGGFIGYDTAKEVIKEALGESKIVKATGDANFLFDNEVAKAEETCAHCEAAIWKDRDGDWVDTSFSDICSRSKASENYLRRHTPDARE